MPRPPEAVRRLTNAVLSRNLSERFYRSQGVDSWLPQLY